MPSTKRSLNIINARENNLKNISLTIPHDQFAVVTGLSGSGKSSLAFATVYAEGQRRYIETFSPYTRQFFDKVKKPDVDLIEQVRPAIAIEQRTRITNSRSTVGTMTNVNDYLKVLWAGIASAHCPRCDIPLESLTTRQIAERALRAASSKGSAMLYIVARYRLLGKKAVDRFNRLKELGFSRLLDPQTLATRHLEDLSVRELKNCEELLVVLDRVRAPFELSKRLLESVELACSLSAYEGKGAGVLFVDPEAGTFPQQLAIATNPDSSRRWRKVLEYRLEIGCPLDESLVIQKARPNLFSFNHPIGACPACKGFGKILRPDPAKVVPDPSKSISEDAIECWAGSAGSAERRKLLRFCAAQGISTTTPWHKLTTEQQELLFSHRSKEYRGIYSWFTLLERKAYKTHVRVFLARYRNQYDCDTCHGMRLNESGRAYKFAGVSLPELCQRTVAEVLDFLTRAEQDIQHTRASGYSKELHEVFAQTKARLHFLIDLGLPYLTLERQARTLSGGETQRVNLAAALGSELISTHFVLDEPSVGLHPRDTGRLMVALRRLQQKQNSLLVVEHDIDCIREADHIIEIGPKTGALGGSVVYNGAYAGWQPFTVTLPQPRPHRKSPSHRISIDGAHARNLKKLSLDFPLQSLVVVTGVSGSGKSTLVHEVLVRGYREQAVGLPISGATSISGFEHVHAVHVVDQSPLAKSPRGNIATYAGIWDQVRTLFADTQDAVARGLSKSAFSFNVDEGRCTECSGAGFIKEDMQFLSDVYIPCEACGGKRFQQRVLEVLFNGRSIADILALSVDQTLELFSDYPKITEPLRVLQMLGLGGITLGHPLSELSGGEAQRLKLAPIIAARGTNPSLLVFDEPTTGLHHYDVHQLLELFWWLRDQGHSLLIVEHNTAVMRAADYLIDLGPEGGSQGGELVAIGTTTELLAASHAPTNSHTLNHLRAEKAAERLAKPPAATLTVAEASVSNAIQIRGAREHNLKNIDIDVPLHSFVALCGVSGSGKSSIAKDIIYAEGQRRYLDCLSPYARQFIKELKRPEIESITNVPPTICVYQHTFQPSRISTVGTMSEAYNFLRLLYAKTGLQHCPDHPDQVIAPMSDQAIAEAIKKLRAKTVRILVPVIKGKKGTHKEIFARAIREEISQVRVDGIFLSPGAVDASGGLERHKVHTIEFVLAKFSPASAESTLIRDVVAQGLTMGAGTLVVLPEGGTDIVYSTERTCPECKRGFFRADPEDLSFSSKRGKCPVCDGTGKDDAGNQCNACDGSRLSAIGRNITVAGLRIHQLCAKQPNEVIAFLKDLPQTARVEALASPVLQELTTRLHALERVGLGHLSLSRECSSLSSGELQRLRLAAAMGSPLSGVLYIFDEPSAGLHPKDNQKVLSQLRALQQAGNSVIMIEHDPESILASDHIIDIGPGGGRNGGSVVYNGPRTKFLASGSPTALALKDKSVLENRSNTSPGNAGWMTVRNATKNNLKKCTVKFPLQALTTVAGVSGAGKSSLVRGSLLETLLSGKERHGIYTLGTTEVELATPFERIIEVDQRPIGANSRSTPASYLGVWDEIRKLFANALEAQSRGWKEGFFSYNTGKGKCPNCKGMGSLTLEMNFLPDASIGCDVCGGSRFTEDAKSVKYLGKNIAEVLRMTFEEAALLFINHRKIHQPLSYACELGLSYLSLGQSSTTLSGGESQRIKLVSELGLKRKGASLYLLDEPTTGLHKADIAKLLQALRTLVQQGSTVVVIEHDQEFIAASDYLIELGPEAGENGGRVIFEGSPPTSC